jgi:hypothetical protein
MIRAAISPAERPSPTATVATGTPAGIAGWKQGIVSLERSGFDRDPNDRQDSQRGDHARQMGGASGCCDDHLKASVSGQRGIIEKFRRGTMG